MKKENKTKKLLSLLLAVVMTLGMLPVFSTPVRADTYPVTGGYITIDKSTGTVTGCDKTVTLAQIPETLGGVTVTSIGKDAFKGCTNLVGVEIPKTVTSIGDSAFEGCTTLVSVKFLDSYSSVLKTVGDSALRGCTKLEKIRFPATVTSIGSNTFYGCTNLKGVYIPKGVTAINNYMFFGCTNLETVNFYDPALANPSYDKAVAIPLGVTSIGSFAFAGCTKLKTAYLPASLTSIGVCTFDSCTALEEVNFDNLKRLQSIAAGAFSNCTKLKTAYLPASVTNIGESAFDGCTSLARVLIPDGVKVISKAAFRYTSLYYVFIGRGVEKIDDYAFLGSGNSHISTTLYYHGSRNEFNAIERGKNTHMEDAYDYYFFEAKYVLDKVDATATELKYLNSTNSPYSGYYFTISGFTPKWKDSNKWSDINAGSAYLYTDAACTNRLTAMPTAGQKFYARLQIWNGTQYSMETEFSKLSGATLNVPEGYTATYKSFQTAYGLSRVGERDDLYVIFEMTYRPGFTPEKVTATAGSLSTESGDTKYRYFSNCSVSINWKDGLVSPNWANHSNAYLYYSYNSTNAVPVGMEPMAGRTYYAHVIIYNKTANNHSIDFSKISSAALTVPEGWSARFSGAEPYVDMYNRDAVKVIFAVTKQFYTLLKVDLTSLGVKKNSSEARYINYTKELTWENGQEPSNYFSSQNLSFLYTNDTCLGKDLLKADPVEGQTYYMKLTFTNLTAGDHSIDFSWISEDSTLTIPGYTAFWYSTNEDRDSSGRDTVDVIFAIRKNYAAGTYVLEKVDIIVPEVKPDAFGEYFLDGETIDLTWKNGVAPGEDHFNYGGLGIFSGDNNIYDEPKVGEKYTVRLWLYNEMEFDHSIDFTKLTDTSTLTMPGYSTKFVGVEKADWGEDYDYYSLIFEVEKKDPADYTLDKVDITAAGVSQHPRFGHYRLYDCSVEPTWRGGNSPSVCDFNTVVYFYTDEDCRNNLTTEPAVGTTYYVRLFIENPTPNDHSIDFSEISSASTLKVYGYTAKFHKIRKFVSSVNQDSVYVIFKVRKTDDAVIELLTESGEPFTVGKVLRWEGMDSESTGEPHSYGYDPTNISMTLLFSGAETPNDALTALNGATFERATQGGFAALNRSISGDTMTLSYTSGDKTVPVMRIRAYDDGGVHIELTSLAPGAVKLTLDGREYLLATPGDVNLDGTMNALDWVTVMRYTLQASMDEDIVPTDPRLTVKLNPGTDYKADYNLWILMADMTEGNVDGTAISSNWKTLVNSLDWITIMKLQLQAWKQ